MLLYITAEDMLGDATFEHPRPRPLQAIPPTLSALYDMGMRHHDSEVPRCSGRTIPGSRRWRTGGSTGW